MVPRKLLLVSAMAQETAALAAVLPPTAQTGVEVHIEVIGIGKVAAAAGTQRLLLEQRPFCAILVGVAGALQPGLRLGDVGLVRGAIDADLDVRAWQPGFRRGEHPLSRERIYFSDTRLAVCCAAASPQPLFPAYVATGSAFLDEPGKRAFRDTVLPELRGEIDGSQREPDLIDMETSAFLQVCHAASVPALALRSVSDTLEGDAATDFEGFLSRASASYARVLSAALPRLAGVV